MGDEPSPGVTGGVDDGVIVLEDAVREPVLAQILPDILDRVQFRSARRQQDRRDVLGHVEFSRCVPAGAIEQQHGMRAFFDMARDFVEMELHHFRVGVGQRQRRAFALGGTDRAEEIGVLVALVGGLTRTGSAPRPLPHEAVLLADARLVLEPDFDRRSRRKVGQMRLQRRFEVFL